MEAPTGLSAPQCGGGGHLDVGGRGPCLPSQWLPVPGRFRPVLPVDHQPGQGRPTCQGQGRESAEVRSAPLLGLPSTRGTSQPSPDPIRPMPSTRRAAEARPEPRRPQQPPGVPGAPRQGGHGCPCQGPTFEGRHLPGLRLGQALLTGVRGQGQGDATAAQQKPHLLAASVLRETERWPSHRESGALLFTPCKT